VVAKNATGSEWKSEFVRIAGDASTKINFNLTGTSQKIMSHVTRGINGTGRAFEYELGQIYQNHDWWSRITWFRNGIEVANPFAQ
jgi:hypothetical protein